ncbi:dCMP deaminase [Entomortierella parvispora]|uniref:Deoxycytidylate deaminase n=1 Tax=Entomortierella parvispora TaxID=205924 RepID=A0A9P3HIV1_9FUNG|nr:dCMP deaminase [Entomortierella parvispora]
MFVGIVGPTHSGKHEVMNMLADLYGFTSLYLSSAPSTEDLIPEFDSRLQLQHQDNTSDESRNANPTVARQTPSPNRPRLVFRTIEAMLDHVTLNWMEHFATCDVNTVQGIATFRKRPFFLLLSVESPMMVRYRRCVARRRAFGEPELSLEEFVEDTDNFLYTSPPMTSSPSSITSSLVSSPESGSSAELFDRESPLSTATSSTEPTPVPHFMLTSQSASLQQPPPYKLLSMSDLALLNPWDDLAPLKTALLGLDITNPDLLRPSWDSYFMYLANLAARRSNCMKRRVGCVLVREKRVIATGYNGTPKNLTNCNDGGCNRCNQATPCGKGLDRCLCMHAEENALLEAGRERVGKESTIYCNTCPCLGCAIKIVQVGVSQVVYSESYGMDDLTAEVFRKAGIELRQHATPGIKLDQSNP